MHDFHPAQGRKAFPDPSWAWPSGKLDQLLKAALLRDDDRAFALIDEWLFTTDIDQVSFREHRLLAAISERFGRRLSSHPAYPRLIGLQRMLWTKSRLAVHESLPALNAMAASGVQLMLIKGAARIAKNPGAQRERISYDIDLVVAPDQFKDAFRLLTDAGWQSASGESPRCLISRADTLRAMNFFKGQRADLDLHQWAYGVQCSLEAENAALWEYAKPATFFGISVLVPSETDSLALSIHHNGLDAHAHSDWMVDCACSLRSGEIDWERLSWLLRGLNCTLAGAVTLGYLRNEIGIEMPESAVRAIEASPLPWFSKAAGVLQASPRGSWSFVSKILRGLAKQNRLFRLKTATSRLSRIKGGVRLLKPERGDKFGDQNSIYATLPVLSPGMAGEFQILIELRVELTGVRRRLEFELNTTHDHIVRLQARNLLGRRGFARVRFEGRIHLNADIKTIELESRPGKQLRAGAPIDQILRYSPVSFSIARFELTPVASK